MLWMPPVSWFYAVSGALLLHFVVIVAIFYNRGWKRGLIGVTISLLALIISVIMGVVGSTATDVLTPIPLFAALAASVYTTIAYARMQ